MLIKSANVKISAISCVIPKNSRSLYDEKDLYDGNQKKIKRVVESSGFLNRCIADKDVTTSDMCLKAAEDIITNLDIKRDEIDALVFISYTPDYIMPATSYVLHKKLGLGQNCICMDVPQGCSGYVLGLYQANMLINSGCRKVLLLVGDSFSKFTDMFINKSAPVFGDAGSATLIERSEDANSCFFNIKSDGNGYDAIICRNGGFRNPVKKEDFYENGSYKYESSMDGGKVFDFTMRCVAPAVRETLVFSGYNASEIDWFVFHQANKMIIQNIALELKIPMEKVPIGTMTEYGNQCGASIPCTIANYLRENVMKKENKKMMLSGFGVGLSWACTVIDFGGIYCSNLIEY